VVLVAGIRKCVRSFTAREGKKNGVADEHKKEECSREREVDGR